MRGIQEILGYSPDGMVARVSIAPAPSNWMAEPLRSRWIGDPLVLDAAFQMAILWTFEKKGLVSLPSYFARYRQYCREFPSQSVKVVLKVQDETQHKITCDCAFLDDENQLVALLTGYEAVMNPSLYKAFKPDKFAVK